MNHLIKHTIPVILILLIGCASEEKVKNTILEISYKAQTRGSYIDIQLIGNTIDFKTAKENKSIVLSNAQINDIKSIVKKITLSEINDLQAPSNRRFTDGALIANFTIKENNTSYISSDFDHDNPPKELKGLYNLIQTFIN